MRNYTARQALPHVVGFIKGQNPIHIACGGALYGKGILLVGISARIARRVREAGIGSE